MRAKRNEREDLRPRLEWSNCDAADAGDQVEQAWRDDDDPARRELEPCVKPQRRLDAVGETPPADGTDRHAPEEAVRIAQVASVVFADHEHQRA